jgi:hypothetical protein
MYQQIIVFGPVGIMGSTVDTMVELLDQKVWTQTTIEIIFELPLIYLQTSNYFGPDPFLM